jgi:hypothetical protein
VTESEDFIDGYPPIEEDDLVAAGHDVGAEPMSGLPARLQRWPRERLAERIEAASYGTVLVLAALAVIDVDHVSSGLGWELISGVGLATWAAHLYAEIVGDHLRHRAAHHPREIRRAMVDGLPIPLAAFLPALMLVLARLDVLDPDVALTLAIAVAFLQLVGLGGLVGYALSARTSMAWRYAAATATCGFVVVTLKVFFGH